MNESSILQKKSQVGRAGRLYNNLNHLCIYIRWNVSNYHSFVLSVTVKPQIGRHIYVRTISKLSNAVLQFRSWCFAFAKNNWFLFKENVERVCIFIYFKGYCWATSLIEIVSLNMCELHSFGYFFCIILVKPLFFEISP